MLGDDCKEYPDLSDEKVSKRYREITQKILRFQRLTVKESKYVCSDEASIPRKTEKKQGFTLCKDIGFYPVIKPVFTIRQKRYARFIAHGP